MTPHCCLQCHLDWEKTYAMPYLPSKIRKKLETDHAILELAGFPRKALDRHSRKEIEAFRKYCPPEIVQQILIDHEAFDSGQMPIDD